MASLLVAGLRLALGVEGGWEGLALRGALLGGVACGASWAAARVAVAEQAFLRGEYPPPRNVAKD